jgi:hypothetical protein
MARGDLVVVVNLMLTAGVVLTAIGFAVKPTRIGTADALVVNRTSGTRCSLTYRFQVAERGWFNGTVSCWFRGVSSDAKTVAITYDVDNPQHNPAYTAFTGVVLRWFRVIGVPLVTVAFVMLLLLLIDWICGGESGNKRETTAAASPV